MTYLTDHFSLEEFIVSETAERLGLDNTPPPLVVNRLLITARGLEIARGVLTNLPVHVLSGYRSPEVNKAVGSGPGSDHVRGGAVDFICPRFGRPLEICRALVKGGLVFDQLIHEYGRWVHLSFRDAPRSQLLTIDRHGTRAGLHEVRP